MTQLIQQTPFWLSITISIAFIGLLGYVFGVKREKDISDESEVIGKDLPVGYQFMKDGKVVEVVGHRGCDGCLYDNPEIAHLDKCADYPLCCAFERVKGDSVVFKYIDHE